jgi:catechol 2,3-dioxygenase-like lactoylglutathione lyase family enzyme
MVACVRLVPLVGSSLDGRFLMFTRIDHVELVPSDFGRSLAFHRDTLGFRLVQQTTLPEGPLREVAYLQLADGVIELMRFDDPVARPMRPTVGYRAIALEVQSMAAATEYLRAKGVTVIWGPMDLGSSVRAGISAPSSPPPAAPDTGTADPRRRRAP